jgi:hypothetical protein
MWRLPLTLLRVLLALVWSVLVVVLLGTSVQAAHSPAPVPSLAPGQQAAPNGWTCHGTTSDVTGTTSQDCKVSGWTAMPVPPPYPSASPMTLPLPVVEQNPAPVDQSTNSYTQTITNEACGDGSATPSPSPSSTPSESASASPSPASTAEYDDACVVRVASRQWIIGGLFAAVFLLLGLVGFVFTQAKGLTT